MSPKADVIVYAPHDGRILTVECKGGKGASKRDAARYRRNLLTHQLAAEDSFFLLVFPNALYLWSQDSPIDGEPEFQADMKSALGPYLGRLADQPGGPREESLELAVSSWLNDLASGLRKPDPQAESGKMLLNSGLYDRLKGGIVETDVDI
jgi:hypothetical protein